MEFFNKLKNKWEDKWEFIINNNDIFICQGNPIKYGIAFFSINSKCIDFYYRITIQYKNKFYIECNFHNIDALLDILTNKLVEEKLITSEIILSKSRENKINIILNT